MGGIIGVILGIITNIFILKMGGIQTAAPVAIIVISFSFSLLVGIFFGIYPANKASKLKPVDALRFE